MSELDKNYVEVIQWNSHVLSEDGQKNPYKTEEEQKLTYIFRSILFHRYPLCGIPHQIFLYPHSGQPVGPELSSYLFMPWNKHPYWSVNCPTSNMVTKDNICGKIKIILLWQNFDHNNSIFQKQF